MKVFVLFCVISLPLNALYNGSPAINLPTEGPMTSKESWMTVKAGYLGSDVFDRKIREAKKFHIWANGGILSLDLFERISFYGYAAAVRMNVKQGAIRYFTETSLGGALGVNAALFQRHDFTLGIDAKYFQSSLDVDSKVGGEILYREWQAGLSAAYTFSYISPYIGVKYARALARFSRPNHYTLSSKHPVGIFIGASLLAPTAVALNLEADFLDETAAFLSLTIRL